jgi:hypothetical protein
MLSSFELQIAVCSTSELRERERGRRRDCMNKEGRALSQLTGE